MLHIMGKKVLDHDITKYMGNSILRMNAYGTRHFEIPRVSSLGMWPHLISDK